MFINFLCEHCKIYAWCPADMTGVPRELVKHALNLDPKARPVKQPLRQFNEPKCKAIAAKLHHLEDAGFIKEIKKSTWVSNPVLVPKKNTKVLHICVNLYYAQ
jgi:hypothetical protein